MRKTTKRDGVESADLIAKRLTELLLGCVDEIPDGYYSAVQLAKMSGRSEDALKMSLNKLKIEKKLLRVRVGNAVKRMAFYKV